MKKIIPSLIFVVAVTLLCGAAADTIEAQDKPPVVIDRGALLANGKILAGQDPLSAELRDALVEEGVRNGFYIGMAIAEGQTLPGPGKDRICASLTRGEQSGCGLGVLFSVERNRNAALALRGAAIAASNPAFSEARSGTTVRFRRGSDVPFYKLGFDIGLAAAGEDTLPGPGKDRIRDSLDASLRSGFNKAVSMALEQNKNNAAIGATTATMDDPGPRLASSEIRCRGYSRPGGSEYVFFQRGSRPSATGETLITYEIAFTPSLKAAGTRGEGLRPGECAWVDRPIGDAGPLRIRFETVANAQLKQKLHGSAIDTSPTAAESYPDVNTIPVYLKGETHYWAFGGITDSGRGYFVASGNSYWKPAVAIGDLPTGSPTEKSRSRRNVFPPRPR